MYALGWSAYLYGPLMRVNHSLDLEEYYGKVIQIGRTSHVDIVHLRLNSNTIDFSLYLDKSSIHYLNTNFDEHLHYRLITQKISSQRHLALAMESEDFALDSQAIVSHMSQLRDYVFIFWLICLILVTHILFMEFKYYRRCTSSQEISK
jgi:hypothetical protein